ncbi:MAG: MFS transporter [Gammaproteobacteria bacterium]|nr:MAG: MFS transporter [Gammaproteobacteria bacterium]UTW43458.1 MFS transporter [bacterium SCSIO 12844]
MKEDSKYHSSLIIYYPMILMISYWVITKAGLPFVDQMSAFFNVKHQSIQRILSLSLIISSLSPLVWGPLIDRIGLKRFVVIASIISFVVTCLMLIVQNVFLFGFAYILATTIIFSLAVCSRSFPFIYFDSVIQKQKSIGITFMGVYFCSFMVPLISGWIGYYLSWQFGYALVLLWLIITFLCMMLINNKQDEQASRVSFLQNALAMVNHLKTQGFLKNVLFVSILNGLAWTYIIVLPFWLAQGFDVSSKYLALYLFPLALPGLVCPVLVKFLESFLTKQQIIKCSIFIFLLGGISAVIIGLFSWHIAYIYIIPGVVMNLASAMAFAIVSTIAYSNVKSHFNAASSLFSLISYFGFGLIVFIESYISLTNYYFEGIFVIVAGIILWFLKLNSTVKKA